MKRIVLCLVILLLPLLMQGVTEKEQIKNLPPQYRDWLTKDVEYIITPVEREVFLKLETDREREVFISAFWKQRNPTPNFPENLFKKEHYRRIEYANRWFGLDTPGPGWRTEMGRIYVTLGEPKNIEKYESESELQPVIIWFYQGMSVYGLPDSFNVAFFKEDGIGDYILYSPVRFGPHVLLRNFEGDKLEYKKAYNQLAGIQPHVADISLSLISGEPVGQPSLASEMLIREKIPQAPQKKVNNLYATKFLQYRGVVEVEYADNYVESSSQLNLFKDRSGHFFIHYLIEPKRLSFEHHENQYFTNLEISGNISTKSGKMITQINRKLPLKLSQEMMGKVKDKLFSLQDLIPVIPGAYRISLIIKNTSNMEFTSMEKDFIVKEPAKPSLSPLLLANRKAESNNPALYKPFSFSGIQILPSPRNDYLASDDLQVFLQVYATPALCENGFLEYTILCNDKPILSKQRKLSEYERLPDVLETFPLLGYTHAYYTIKVVLQDQAKKELFSQQSPFFITPQSTLPRPWVVSLPTTSFNKILHELGNQHLQAGNLEAARDLLGPAFAKESEDPILALDYCKALMQLKDYTRVKEVAQPLLEKNKRFEFAFIMGQSCQELAEFETAISYYAEYLTHFGAQPPVFNRIAECYLQLDLPDEALKAFEKSLEIEPKQPDIKEKIALLKKKAP